MNVFTTFDSTREALSDILGSIRAGKTQLPDFQRGWVWDDDHIRSVLASVSKSFPVGAVMMLQTGNPNVRLRPRPVEGAPDPAPHEPERLVLDGQQRLTSLYQALFSGIAVKTRDARKRPMSRWYYVDVRKALDPNAERDDAIIGVPEDKIVRSFRGEVLLDYSTVDKECEAEVMPLPLVFDQAAFTNWQLKYIHGNSADAAKIAERLARWNEFVQKVVQPFQQYQVPLIVLRKETPKEAVCQVFEKVNTGGVQLTVFELLTATFAAEPGNFRLRLDWKAKEAQLKKHAVLATVKSDDFLQAITLLATLERRTKAIASGTKSDNAPGVSCKRKDVLDLALADYQRWEKHAVRGFIQAAKFLHGQGLFTAYDLPYRTQLVPLAATLTELGDVGETDGARAKLAKWFWCGVFGELYGSAAESRFAKDIVDLVAWIRDGGPEPSTIIDASFAAGRLLRLKSRNSAAYKGIHALLLLQGGLDFRSGHTIDTQTYFEERIDIHHVFPRKWCEAKGIQRGRFNCIVNKTPISAKTNRIIGGNAPSVYLAKLEKQAGIDQERMNDILTSHLIDPKALRTDDFEAYFAARAEALLAQIEKAMGKQIQRGGSEPEPEDELDEELEDVDAVA